jgi:hypothetical protein
MVTTLIATTDNVVVVNINVKKSIFIGHQDTNMAKVILARMNEWHQVQRKYALEIDVQYIFDLHEESKTLEECQVIFDQLESGEMSVEDLEEVGQFGMDWEYQDDDDWWTMRKGGYDVTYDQEVIDKPEPISDNPEFVAKIEETKQAFKDYNNE